MYCFGFGCKRMGDSDTCPVLVGTNSEVFQTYLAVSKEERGEKYLDGNPTCKKISNSIPGFKSLDFDGIIKVGRSKVCIQPGQIVEVMGNSGQIVEVMGKF